MAVDGVRAPVSCEGLVSDLGSLGLKVGDVVLVHSSLSSLGQVEGGAQTVIAALLKAVAPGGTVLAPTLTGRRHLSPAHPPVFDPARTPCWTGLVPETLRRLPLAVRSWHPTHSVAAIGPAADTLARDHHLAPGPCGPDTPYARLAEMGGKVLFVGIDLTCITMLHGVEEAAGLAYVLQDEPVEARIILPNGPLTVRTRLHYYGPERNFPALEPFLVEAGAMRVGRVAGATCRLVEAGEAWSIAAERLAADPEFFLAEEEKGLGWPNKKVR